MIVLSVAHTKLAAGAKTANGLYEYDIGKVASRAAFESLYAASIPCALVEVGYFTREGCMGVKQQLPTKFAKLAVEIHCNASAESAKANYAETIYHPKSLVGKSAAEAISVAMAKGFGGSHKWPSNPARGDASLFFLKGPTPSVIVEGLFVSNPEQAAWLEANGGPEAYGLLVAEGLKSWWATL